MTNEASKGHTGARMRTCPAKPFAGQRAHAHRWSCGRSRHDSPSNSNRYKHPRDSRRDCGQCCCCSTPDRAWRGPRQRPPTWSEQQASALPDLGLRAIRYVWVALRLHLLILHALRLHALRLHALRLHALAAALLGGLAAACLAGNAGCECREKAEHGDDHDREPKERVLNKDGKQGKTHFMVTTRMEEQQRERKCDT